MTDKPKRYIELVGGPLGQRLCPFTDAVELLIPMAPDDDGRSKVVRYVHYGPGLLGERYVWCEQ